MAERISILLDFLPRYGEILLGIGSIAVDQKESLLDNIVARESIKSYLLEEAPKRRTLIGVSKSDTFQRIMYNYTGKRINIGVIKQEQNSDKEVNFLLHNLFKNGMWPIIVKRYMDTIFPGIDSVIVPMKVKKETYFKIYEEESPDLFFAELKDFLLSNYIIICESKVNSEGDLLIKLLIPIPDHGSFNC